MHNATVATIQDRRVSTPRAGASELVIPCALPWRFPDPNVQRTARGVASRPLHDLEGEEVADMKALRRRPRQTIPLEVSR